MTTGYYRVVSSYKLRSNKEVMRHFFTEVGRAVE